MYKKFLLSIVFLSVLALCGCEYFAGAAAGMIIPPPDKSCPFNGKWEVFETLSRERPAYGEDEKWIGDSVQFAEDAIVFGDLFWGSPSYKAKRVDAESYLTTKNLDSSLIPAINSRIVDIVTIYAANNYLGEFMKIDENDMIFFIQNNALLLGKVSGQVDIMPHSVYEEAQSQNTDGGESFSGALIGLRNQTRWGDYTYRTLRIAANSTQLRPILTADHIFFPRMSGFWECIAYDASSGIDRGNILIASSAFSRSSGDQRETEAESEADDTVEQKPAFNIINYIGNDYVSVESVAGGSSQLCILPVDTLPSQAKIKIVDLLGENGLRTYKNARTEASLSLRNEGVTDVIDDDDGENFGLFREKGHWKLVGRVNYQEEEASAYSDFELKIIPPNNLIFFDTLALNWNRIKDRVPDALDAFTSPDKKIALVKTRNKIAVYAIGVEQLSENFLGEIELMEGETIVMAEWATSIYVDSWERTFIAYGAVTHT